MSTADESAETRRVPPDDSTFLEERRQLADRNEKARQAGKQQRQDMEREAALGQARRDQGKIYR